jgi:hypothetical protein
MMKPNTKIFKTISRLKMAVRIISIIARADYFEPWGLSRGLSIANIMDEKHMMKRMKFSK